MHTHPFARAWVVAFAGIAAAACSRTRPAATAASAAPPPAADPAPAAGPAAAPTAAPTKPTQGNVTSTSSAHIAAGKPRPAAAKYRKVDALSGTPVYFGDPEMKLDDKTIADVSAVLEQTCGLLREGVELLEKHAKTPEKAAKALAKHHKDNATRIQGIFTRAADVKARLRSAGYDQDIPAEVRADVDKCMTPLFDRLEKVRSVYVGHTEVLEAFGKLFPRTPR